eukprot:3070805-Prorocentrum_lima.AAC.1
MRVPQVVAAAAVQCCVDLLAAVARPEALRKMARHALPVLFRCAMVACDRLAPAPVMRMIVSVSSLCSATWRHAAVIPAMVRGTTRRSSSSAELQARRRSCASVIMMLGRTSPSAARTTS